MSIANTASLSTDLATSPYYDDFSEGKNFHRILFRPGQAVQARELTQMQTILQNQIDRFAEHIFEEGSIVRGCEMNYDTNVKFVRVRNNNQSASSVNATAFINTTITGATSGATAYVLDAADGSEAGYPNTKTLFVRYTGAGANGTVSAFSSGEVLSTGVISANVITSNSSIVATGSSSRISFGAGVLYAKDHFIRVDADSVIVGKYTSNTSIKVGYTITESIVDSSADATLLDPAQGAYNYAAPGADRLKLEATLTTKSLTALNDTNFIERIRIKNGNPEFQVDKPTYSVIEDYIARRTYDESGDYIVSGLTTRVREHLNSANNGGVYTAGNGGDIDKLVVDISPGKAYVKGYEVDNIITNHVTIDKATDVNSVEGITVPTNYGNYTIVKELVGTWDINGHDRVDLYNAPIRAISNNSFTAIVPSTRGTKIGEARVRAIEYASGTSGAPSGTYNMYLYDINMSANSFSYVRSIYFDDATTDGIADTVLTSNSAVLYETSFNRSLFNIPASNIKTLRDTGGNVNNEFRFLKEFPVTIAAGGTVTITTGAVDELYPFSVGALNDTQERENFLVILEGSANTATALQTTAAKATGANTVTGLTNATTKYNVGDIIKLQGIANTFVISEILGATSVKVYGSGTGSGTTSSATLFKNFKAGQVISLNGYGGDNSARGVTINSTTSATIDIQETLSSTVAASVIVELKKVDGQEKAKVINKNKYVQINISGSGTTVGPWGLGVGDGFALKEVRYKTGNTAFSTTTQGTDVTNQFELDTGMRDNLYEHSKIKLKSSATHTASNGNVYLVKFDYFSHDTSQGVGFFSVDSYPIDDANSSNTTAITTAEIPIYTSPTTGARYDLRNHVDIRPLVANTCAPSSALPSPINPTTSTSIVEPSGGLRFMAPNEDFISDFDYYLPRKDRIVITSQGQFRAIKGVPNLVPQTPAAPSDGMTIGVVNVNPYPSLPQEIANKVNTATSPNGRNDLSIKVDPVRIRRFTMKDIQGLEQRIDNLEYYTSLSLLESDTKNLFLADASGTDRFKNGIVVDQFVDFSSSDFYNEGYKVAIDKQNKELRPSFKLDEVQLSYISANSSGVSSTSKDTRVSIASASAIYTTDETVTQGAASGTLVYQVGTRLYLKNVSGTFTTSANVVGGTSAATSAVSSVSAAAAGKLILLPWTHDLTISQPFATDTRNATGLNYSFVGSVELSPSTDYWKDTIVAPSVTMDFGFLADAIGEVANHMGINWNDWSTTSTTTSRAGIGTIVQNTGSDFGPETAFLFNTTTNANQQRTGALLNVSAGNLTQTNLGDSVQDVSLVPFMRSRVINFTGRGLKPSTKVYAFFDGHDVSDYISPANSSFSNTASEGSSLLTDASGIVYGNFRLPNDNNLRFPTGNLKFRLTDSATNSSTIGATTTSAETTYSASGLDVLTRGTIVSTRDIDISTTTIEQTRTIQVSSEVTIGGPPPQSDPIAQTFRVSDGISSTIPGAFLSKIDIYFASKDATQPVIVEIRECDPATAYVTGRVVPFSKVVVAAADINTSSDSSSPTPIVFETPVYLLNNVDYAIVIKPVDGNPNVTVWTARLGETDILTGNRITQQPAAGMLFASANDRVWTAIQEEDLKFKLYFANFGTNSSGTAVFKNTDKEYLTIDTKDTSDLFSTIGETINAETTLTLSGAIGGSTVGDTLVGLTSAANGTITYVSGSTIRVKDVTTATKFTNAETIKLYKAGLAGSNTATLSSQATPTGKVYFFDSTTQSNTMVHISEPSGTFTANTWIRGQISGLDARIASVDNLKLDVFQAFLSKLELQDTTASMTAKLATSASTLDSAFRTVNLNTDTVYDARRYVLSRSNEVANLSSAKSAQFVAALTNGANVRHSPAIDNDRAAVFTVENLINNDSTDENTTTNGSAIARYIQRTITLADGQDAEDLKVFITAYKPSTASIKIYAKILSNEDGEPMDEKTWIELDQITSATVVSDSENTRDFKEYEYNIPTSYLTGTSGEVQYTDNAVVFTGFKRFKIKIVLLSSTPSRVPRLKDFRAIALQI